MKIERKDPLLSTLVNVEDGGEGVDTAIRKLDREFENVIEGANLIGDKVEELNTDVATLKGIDTSVFAKKEELINVVAGGGINIVQTGNEKKISSSIGNATSTESGLMSFIDKNLVDSWDDKRDSLIGHVGESEKHIPVGGITGQVLAKKSLDPYDVEWRNVGGATPAVYRVANKTPDEFGNVDLQPLDIRAVSQTDYNTGMASKADTNHTHPEVNGTQAGFMGIDDKEKLDELSSLGITPIGNAGEALVVTADGTGTEWGKIEKANLDSVLIAEINGKINNNDSSKVKELAGTRLWVSGECMPVFNTPTIVTHGLTLDPQKCRCDVLLKCIEPDGGYSAGDYAIGWFAAASATLFVCCSPVALLTSTIIQFNTGARGSGIGAVSKTTGVFTDITLAKWRYVFRIWH